jgi:hypothetical protein
VASAETVGDAAMAVTPAANGPNVPAGSPGAAGAKANDGQSIVKALSLELVAKESQRFQKP